MKKIISILMVFICLVVLIGCGEEEQILPTSVRIEAQRTTITVDDSLELKAIIEPSNAQDKTVTWSTSNSEVLTVSSNGRIKGISSGEAFITVTSKANSNVSDKVKITVEEAVVILPTDFVISGQNRVEVNQTIYLKAEFTPTDTTQKGITWTSSDPTIATINDMGQITGLKDGTVTITATSKAKLDLVKTFSVTVFTGQPLEDLQLSCADETLVIGFNFNIKVTPTPTNASYKIEWVSSDPEVATIDEANVITPLKSGHVKFTAVLNNDNVADKELEFDVIERPDLVSMTVPGRTIATNETCTLVINTTPKYAKYNVTFVSSDEKIATVDEYGVVTPITTGKVTITITDETSISTTAEIVIEKPFDPNAKPTNIEVSGLDSVFVGYSIQLSAQVFPTGVSQSIKWEVPEDSKDLCTIDSTGLFKALKEGTVRIKAVSTVDESVKSKAFRITIKPEPKQDPPQNLGGYEIIIMQSDSALWEIDPFHPNYKNIDQAYKQKAWREVETDYNCTIKVVEFPAVATWGSARIDWLIDKANSNKSECDFAFVSSAWIYKFAQNGASVNTTTFFNKYGMNQIDQATKESGMYNNKLYIVSTGIPEARTWPIKGLFYNVGLVERLGLESPAKLFNDDKWSYDDFVDYCKKAQSLLADDEYAMSGAPSTMWAGMVNSGGVKLADKATLKINIKHQYSYDAVNALREIVVSNAWNVDNFGYDAEDPNFIGGKAIFAPGEYWFVRSDMRFKKDLWGDDTRYGYVPFPYPKDKGKDGAMLNSVGESVMMMVNGKQYPAGVTSEFVFRALQTVFLNSDKYLKNDPQYNPVEIKYNSTSSRIDDPESIAATVWFTADKTIYDPMFEQSFQWEHTGEAMTAVHNIVIKGQDAAQEFESVYSAVEASFIKIYGA